MSHLHPGLYPRSNEISLSSKLSSQPFMGMLACHLLLESAISLRNQLLHLKHAHIAHTKGSICNCEKMAPAEESYITLHYNE